MPWQNSMLQHGANIWFNLTKWDVRKDKIRLQHTGDVWFQPEFNFNLYRQRFGLKYVLIASKKKMHHFYISMTRI